MTRPPVGQFNYFGALGPTLPKKHKHSVEPTLQFSDGIKLRPKLGNRFLKFGQPLVLWGNLLSRPARDELGDAIHECLIKRADLLPRRRLDIAFLLLCSPMLALPRMAKATERPRWPQALPCLALPVVSGSSWSLALGPWTLDPGPLGRSSLVAFALDAGARNPLALTDLIGRTAQS